MEPPPHHYQDSGAAGMTAYPGYQTPPSSLTEPGAQVQTVDNRMDGTGGLGPGMIIVIIAFIILMGMAITCGVLRLCKKEEHIEGVPTYSVAISNRLFKGGDSDSCVKEGGMDKELPCLNCRLIEMGEMACYQDRCPQCGQVPPGKKHLYEDQPPPQPSRQQQQHAARQDPRYAKNGGGGGIHQQHQRGPPPGSGGGGPPARGVRYADSNC